MYPHFLQRYLPLLSVCLWGQLSFYACVDRALESHLIIEVKPDILSPGRSATITGRGFGPPLLSNEQVVAIAGRPLIIDSWSDTLITATLPADLAGGDRVLTLSTQGQPLASTPVFVGAPLAEETAQNRDLVASDLGVTTMRSDDMYQEQDFGMPDMMRPIDVKIEYTPERDLAQVGLEPSLVLTEEGKLELQVNLTLTAEQQRQTWGIASHLKYPQNRLNFLGITQQTNRNLNVTTTNQLPGKVLFYRVNPTEVVMTLRFEVLDSPQTLTTSAPFSLSFVPRFSGIRDLQKQPTTVIWSGGSVRYVEP